MKLMFMRIRSSLGLIKAEFSRRVDREYIMVGNFSKKKGLMLFLLNFANSKKGFFESLAFWRMVNLSKILCKLQLKSLKTYYLFK